MKFSLSRKAFADALDLTAGVIAKKTMKPILQNVLLTAKDGVLELSATDLEISIIISLNANIEQEGQATVLNHLLREIVKATTADEIELFYDSSEKIQIQALGKTFHAFIHTSSHEDFPVISKDEINSAPAFFIKGFVLKEMLDKNLPFSAKDDSRYIFNSVLFEKESLEFKSVSSDTKRLALAKTFIETEIDDFTMIIPSKTARIVKDMIGEKDLEVRVMNKKTGFLYENIILITNQIEGKFPDYKMVIPKETNYNILVSKDEFSEIIRSLAPFFTGDIQKVSLSFEPELLKVFTEETESGKGENSMEIDYQGEAFETAFSFKYLQDIISVIAEDQIYIKFFEPEKPAIFVGKENDSFLFVTVPITR